MDDDEGVDKVKLNVFFVYFLLFAEKKFYEDEFPHNLLTMPIDYLNHEQIYEEALIKLSSMLFEALNLDDPREAVTVGEAIHHEASPFLLHFVMFIPAIMGHGNDEQQARWLADAIELKIIGSYAQTELGHGSYLKGLQTRADYDREKDEFTIHTPNLEAIKWWPGGLGKTSNYAIVLAQLYHDNIHRGLHPFMVQIRDLDSHVPLPGIEVGEIGPRMGFKAADNGYLRLNKVKIARTNMLMKNATIDENGDYHAIKETSKLNLGTMLFVRVIIIEMITHNICKAVTIATRYSAVRRQGPNPIPDLTRPETCEMKILDYSAQMYKLLPAIGAAHAFKGVSIALMHYFKDAQENMSKRGDFQLIPFLHAITSGIKALTTDIAANVVETCRKACGGQGFLLVSGLPRIFANTVAACTYEGENTILYLQTAKYLYKYVSDAKNDHHQVMSQDSASFVTFLMKERANEFGDIISGEISFSNLLPLFAASAHYRVHQFVDKVNDMQKINGLDFESAWIRCQIDSIKSAQCYLRFFILTQYNQWLANANSLEASLCNILNKVGLFYILHQIVENQGDFYVLSIPTNFIDKCNQEMQNIMHSLRPDMIPLVDAFDLHDMVLMSAIGMI